MFYRGEREPDALGRRCQNGMCRDCLLRYAGSARGGGGDPKTHRQIRTDLVGVPAEGGEYLVCSCRYSDRPVGADELERLRYPASVFGKVKKYAYCIFSKGGSSEGLRESSGQGQVTLLTLADLYR